MKWFSRKSVFLAVFFVLVYQAMALAAVSTSSHVAGVRFGSGSARDRIVFDLDQIPEYQVSTANSGKQIILDMASTAAPSAVPNIHSDVIQQVSIAQNGGSLRVTIDLVKAAEYKVQTVGNPPRLFIDISREIETETKDEPAPGLKHTLYVRQDKRGMLTAHLLEVDRSRYTVRPALANGEILGRQTVSGISDANNAMAAINASYFAPDGEILGITKMDGTIVSTTYFTRSALGIAANGVPFIGQVGYNGSVTMHGATVSISGVNCERGADSLVLYNRYFDATTNTNEYGQEYIVRDGKVVGIHQANSSIPEKGFVVSVHGTAKDAFANVKVGDKVTVVQDIGSPWTNASVVVSAGPTLVKGGQVEITDQEEQFPNDITYGRAPRTAVGIMANGNLLLAVVDGRQDSSIGCTLTEMGELMKKFGAVDAVNYDGGGSSEMVVGGQVMNSPSDGMERPVGCALVVVKK